MQLSAILNLSRSNLVQVFCAISFVENYREVSFYQPTLFIPTYIIGTYQPYSGQSNCTECEPGFYCLENSTQPTECPIYYYCPAGSAVGEFCPNGTFGNVSGLYHPDQCADCPTGSYCRDGQVTGENFSCKSVFYWGEAAKNVEIDVRYNFPHLMFCFAYLFDPFI